MYSVNGYGSMEQVMPAVVTPAVASPAEVVTPAVASPAVAPPAVATPAVVVTPMETDQVLNRPGPAAGKPVHGLWSPPLGLGDL